MIGKEDILIVSSDAMESKADILIETIRVKDEDQGDDVMEMDEEEDEMEPLRISHPLVMVERIPVKNAKIEVGNYEGYGIVKREQIEAYDPDPLPSNEYQLLKDVLQEAKVSLEKAQEHAANISQNQDFVSNDISDYFTQTASSIDQAVISTTLGLSALDSILIIREDEKYDMTELKEDFQNVVTKLKKDVQENFISDEESCEIATDLNPEPSPEDDDTEQIYNCNFCDYSTTAQRSLHMHTKYKHDPKKYKCENCDYLANNCNAMKNHMKQKHEISSVEYLLKRENPDMKYFLCQSCSYGNTDKKLLELHIKENHKLPETLEESQELERKRAKARFRDINEQLEEGSEVFSCTRCSYTTKNKVYFDDHVSGEYNYIKCHWCDYHYAGPRFNTAAHLRIKHGFEIKEESGDFQFKCPDCDFKAKNGGKIIKHANIHHKTGAMFHCSKCEYSGRTMSLLKKHAEEHNEATFFCDQCPYVAKSKFRLQKHIFKSHNNVLCDDCGTVFRNSDNLKRHKPVCSKPTNRKRGLSDTKGFTRRQINLQLIKCGLCQFTTKRLLLLKRHYDEQHKDVGEIEHKCSLCDHISTTVEDIYQHTIKEHKEKNMKCDECDFATTTANNLRLHKENKHSNGTGHSCEICGMVFKRYYSWQKHLRSKHGPDTVKVSCSEAGCNYTAANKTNLRLHVEKVHLGIKWPCNMCQYVGPYKGDLNRHMKKVHNIVPEGSMIRCDLCHFNSISPATIAAHKEKVHGF